MLKKILIGIVGVIVVLLIVGFALPSKFEITKSAQINAPAQYVFEEVNNLPSWEAWSYWHSLDPKTELTYSDQKSGKGASYAWKSDETGEGKLVITESTPSASLAADLFFMESAEPSKASYKFEPNAEGTNVTMSFSTDFGMNPIMRWMGVVMFPSEMGKAFDYNLSKLKEISEAKPKFSVAISEEEAKPTSYIGIATTMSFEDPVAIDNQITKSFTELTGVLVKSKVEMTGAPFAIYTKWDEATKQMEMVCAVPVAEGAKVPAKYKIMKNEGGKTVKAIHNGNYKTMKSTHDQIMQYITFKKLELIGAPWEVYVSNPFQEKDTAKWVTEIYYPVKP